MNLTLEVISANGSGLGAGRSKVFGAGGGRIGRGSDCDWVLPSPNKYVSRHHATVMFANGTYYIKAEGQNEVAINDPNMCLAFGKPSPIRHRDRVFIDEYEILANLVSESTRSAPLIGDPFADDEGPVSLIPAADPFDGENLDPLSALPSLPERPGAKDRNYVGAPHGDVLSEPLIFPATFESTPATPPETGSKFAIPTPARMPARSPAATATATSAAPTAAPAGFQPIPIDPDAWDKTSFAPAPQPRGAESMAAPAPMQQAMNPRAATAAPTPLSTASQSAVRQGTAQPTATTVSPTPTPTPPERRAPAAAQSNSPPPGGLDIDSLLRATGVDPRNVDPAIAATLGQIFKMVVQGTIDALRARDEVKSQFRLAVTRVRTTENNPLAFSVDAADAINSMLVRRNAAFLPPVEAFQRAFDDIRFHQLAMVAGMRAGFESLMSQFDPEALNERFDKQAKRGGILGVVAKPNYWELYADYFGGLRGDRDDAFRRLFGEEFALAYEKQIALLKRGGQKS